MPKLDPKSQIKLNKATIVSFLQEYHLSLKSFTVAKSGIENTTALVTTNQGNFALRIYRKDKKKASDIQQELDFMLLLSKHKLPVPKIFPNSNNQLITQKKIRDTVWNCILMEQMPGIHPRNYSLALLKEMAYVQARMHELGVKFTKKQVQHRKFPKVIKEANFIKNIELDKIKDQDVLAILHRAKNFRVHFNGKLPYGYNHLDYDHANILVKNNKLSAILDFDDLCYSPLIVCFGYTLWDVLFTTKKPSSLFEYLKYYQANRKLKPAELQILKDILRFRNYVIGSLEIMFYGEDGKFVKSFLKYEKVINELELPN